MDSKNEEKITTYWFAWLYQSQRVQQRRLAGPRSDSRWPMSWTTESETGSFGKELPARVCQLAPPTLGSFLLTINTRDYIILCRVDINYTILCRIWWKEKDFWKNQQVWNIRKLFQYATPYYIFHTIFNLQIFKWTISISFLTTNISFNTKKTKFVKFSIKQKERLWLSKHFNWLHIHLSSWWTTCSYLKYWYVP